MSLVVRVAPHPDALVDRLCDDLARPLGVFDAEVVVVPTPGIERWLTQRLATGLAERGIADGICAHVRFPHPDALSAEVLAAVDEVAPAVAAWARGSLDAALVEAFDLVSGPESAPLRRHVHAEEGTDRVAVARRLAGLFDRYDRYRPAMLRRWAAGEDVGPDGSPLDAAHAWQPPLFRAVRDLLGRPAPAELLPEALEPLRAGRGVLDLPERLAVYGLTAADPRLLDVLEALAATRDVALHVLHPSPALWRRARPLLAGEVPSRGDDPTADLARHPLAASWGRDARELQQVLAARGLDAEPVDVPDRDDTLLGRLQADLRNDRPPEFDADLAAAVEAGRDRSVEIHACHGSRRQAEVARDAVLHALAADPTLEPRDVVVMTPDLETFAPLLEAAFPRGDAGLPDLRLRIADRAPAVINPLVRIAADLLDLPAARFQVSTVEELLHEPAVRRRFGIDEERVGELLRLVDDARVAWGLDAADRAAWGVPGRTERTWDRALERILTGVAYADDDTRVVAGIAPLGGIEGDVLDAVDVLAALVDRLHVVRELLAEPRPRSEWAEAIGLAVSLLAVPARDEEWQRSQLDRLLHDTFGGDGPDPTLTRRDARRAIAPWTEDRPSPLHFRTGDLTVCSLVPMRSVPYRVVCLVGMDDDRFPRSSRDDGDDLLVADERVGDPDRAAEDRQLLLDALMAAEDRFIVVYAGRDELTNAELPPAVPIAELQETIAEMIGVDPEDFVVHHPLQPFSERNFVPGELGLPGPWGFDPHQLAAAEALRRRTPAAPTPWPEAPPPDEIDLDDLVAFLADPPGYFLRRRVGITPPEEEDEPADVLPVDLHPLDRWRTARRLLDGLLRGKPTDEVLAALRAADELPPGTLADDELVEVVAFAEDLAETAGALGYDPRRLRPHHGVVEARLRVEGTVWADPETGLVAEVTPTRLRAKPRLGLYARLVFLTALRPDVAWRGLLVGRHPDKDPTTAVGVDSLGDDPATRRAEALGRLDELLGLYLTGLAEPLPLPPNTGFYVRSHRGKAARAFEGDTFHGIPGERDAVAFRLLWPEVTTLDDLLALGVEASAEALWAPIFPLFGRPRP